MSATPVISDSIRTFVLSKFPLARKRELQDGDLLLESGILDSMGVLEIVHFIEQEFGILVVDDELVPENFQSIQQLTEFVNKKLGKA
jgi:acyl carrier protein